MTNAELRAQLVEVGTIIKLTGDDMQRLGADAPDDELHPRLGQVLTDLQNALEMLLGPDYRERGR